MTYSNETLGDVACFDGPVLSQRNAREIMFGGVTAGLAALAAVCVYISLYHPSPALNVVAAPQVPPVLKATDSGNPYGALPSVTNFFDPPPQASADPGYFANLDLKAGPPAPIAPAPAPADVPAPPQPALEAAQSIPLPPPRPPLLRPSVKQAPIRAAATQAAPTNVASAAPSSAPDTRNFFQKLFDVPEQPNGPVLAYAQPEDGAIRSALTNGNSSARAPYDSFTAIYDLQARTVYLPDGEKLEAHSGYGQLLDDPTHVNEKDRGATPPHVYDLSLREQLFHGVQALRLIPVGGGNMYGRTGLLAHTYMLGPNGDSNGCVSFKDYSKFLEAYTKGEIKHLVVVSHLS